MSFGVGERGHELGRRCFGVRTNSVNAFLRPQMASNSVQDCRADSSRLAPHVRSASRAGVYGVESSLGGRADVTVGPPETLRIWRLVLNIQYCRPWQCTASVQLPSCSYLNSSRREMSIPSACFHLFCKINKCYTANSGRAMRPGLVPGS